MPVRTLPAAEMEQLLVALGRALRAYGERAEDDDTGGGDCVGAGPGVDPGPGACAELAALWRRHLEATGPLEVRVENGSFFSSDGRPLSGPGLGDLALELSCRGVRHFEVGPEVGAAEFAVLTETLADAQSGGGAGHLESLLAARGVRNVRFCSVDAAAVPRALAGSDADPLGDPPTADTGTLERVDYSLQQALLDLEQAPATDGAPADALERIEQECVAFVAEGQVRPAVRAIRTLFALATRRRRRHRRRSDAPELAKSIEGVIARLLQVPALAEKMLAHTLGSDPETALSAAQIFGLLGRRSVPFLLEVLGGPPSEAQRQAASLLIAIGDDALAALVGELGSPDPVHARRAARLLGEMQNPRAVEYLALALEHPDVSVRVGVARALARIGRNEAVRALINALGAGSEVAEVAANGLGSCPGRSRLALAPLLQLVDDARNPDAVRREAIRSLGRLGQPEAVPVLRRVLEAGGRLRRRSRDLRLAAASALGAIPTDEARAALHEVARHCSDADLRMACVRGMEQIELQPVA